MLAFDPIGQGERQMYPELTGGLGSYKAGQNPPLATDNLLENTAGYPRGGSLLPSSYADACYIDAVIVSKATFEHEYLGRQLFLNGRSAASLWVQDMFVLMDVLETTPGVDPSRLGVAGCSGGGTQAAYHSSVDERVAVVSIGS